MGVVSLDLQQTDAGQGIVDYTLNVINKPKINGVIIDGDLTTADLHISVPQFVSELQNDAGYVTKNVSDLISYYDKAAVDAMVSTIPKFSILVVDELPTENISPTTVYLLRVQGNDHFEEYIYVNDEWDKLGDGNIDFSDFATYTYVDEELAEKVNISDISAVARSGKYSDLTGVPTSLSQFNNDSGFITSSSLPTKTSSLVNDGSDGTSVYVEEDTLSTVAKTGAYDDLSGVPTKVSDFQNDVGYLIEDNISALRTDVATNSTDIANLDKNKADKNEIPAVGDATLTIQRNGETLGSFTANATTSSSINIGVPTKVSEVTNDLNFVDNIQVNTALAAYTYPSQDLYTRTDVDTLLSQISALKIEVVETLPQTGSSTTIYLLRVRQQGNDLYQEYFWVNNAWELIGGIDLTDYYTKTETDNLLSAKADTSDIPTKTSQLDNNSDFPVDANYVHTDNNYTTAEKDKLSSISSGAEVNVQSDWSQTNSSADDYIKNKPSIPTKTSDLNNDSGYITSSAIPTKVSSFSNDVGYLDSIPDDSVGLNQLDSTVVNAINNINNKANTADLATVAFSGSYVDLTNVPAIPTKTSELENDSGFLTSLPVASATTLGGVKVGNGLAISDGVLSATGISVGTITTAEIDTILGGI